MDTYKLKEVPEIEFYRTELGRSLKELEFGIDRYSILDAQEDKENETREHNGSSSTLSDTADERQQFARPGKGRAIAMVQVLEGQQVFVECVNEGFRVCSLPCLFIAN